MRPLLHRGIRPVPVLLGLALILMASPPVQAQSFEAILDLANGGTAGLEAGGERSEIGPQGAPIMQSRYGCLVQQVPGGLECIPCNGGGGLRHQGFGTVSALAGQTAFYIDVSNPCPQGDEFGFSFAQARFTIDDLIVVAPPGVTPPQVIQVSLNVESSVLADVVASGYAPLSVAISTDGGAFASLSPPQGTSLQTTSAFGLFTDRPNALTFTLAGSVRTPPGDSFASHEASAGFPSGGAASSAGVLRVAQATPVFNLPEGYSINSAQAGIVNNIWNAPVPTKATSWGRLKTLYE